MVIDQPTKKVEEVKSRKVLIAHSLFLQVVSHLLMLMLRQLLVPVVIVLGEDGLDLRLCMPLSVS